MEKMKSFYKNKKVLVTGATGFKGAWLCAWLLKLGAKVYYAESLEKLLPNMNIAQPTIMTAVPRFYQNLYNKISLNFSKQKGFKKKLIENTILLETKNLNKSSSNHLEQLSIDPLEENSQALNKFSFF